MDKQELRSSFKRIYAKDMDKVIADYKKMGYQTVDTNIDENNMQITHMKLSQCSKTSIYIKTFGSSRLKKCRTIVFGDDTKFEYQFLVEMLRLNHISEKV